MSKEIYNKFFEHYGPNIHFDPIRFTEIAKLCKGRVLDIGCGTGTLADFYKGDYIGVDISDVAIEMAKKTRTKTATFLVEDATIPWKDDGVKNDTIVMAEFLEHIKDDKVVFDNIKKVAKRDTRLIISVPNGDRIPDPTHLRTFTIPELRKKLCPLGKVKFYNWQGAKARILLTVDLGQKNDNLLSLVMPVKNEGKGLEQAILSCINFVDNIVISVDTESADNTLNIAQRYADVVKKYQWENSFAKARNNIQKYAKSKWVLHLDGHEYVKNHEKLNEMLSNNVEALFVKIILESGFNFYYPRIIKQNIKWQHDVHNTPITEKNMKYDEFVIIHDRTNYQSEHGKQIRSEQREQMITTQLGADLKKDKNNIRANFYTGNLMIEQKEWKEAIHYFLKVAKFTKIKSQKWLVHLNLGICYNELGKPLRALWHFYKAEKTQPNRWEIAKMKGTTYALLGWHKKAMEHWVDSFKINTGQFMFSPLPRNDAETWDFISLTFAISGQMEKSIIAALQALKEEMDNGPGLLPPEKIKILKTITNKKNTQ